LGSNKAGQHVATSAVMEIFHIFEPCLCHLLHHWIYFK